MADTTITLNAGSGGKNIAVDRDTNSPQADYQYVKPVFGAAGTYTKVTSSVGFPVNIVQNSLNSSTVATNDSPQNYVTSFGLWDSTSSPNQYVRAPGDATNGIKANITNATLAATQSGTWNITNVSGTVSLPTGAATAANQTTGNTSLNDIATAVQIMDDWDETDRAKVNIIVGQAGIAAGTGVDGATVPRVTLATDVPLPAGTNGIGKLTANSGVDIGDVDVTSISAGSNLIGDIGLSGARTSGGTTLYKNIDVDETEDQVKASAGQIYWIYAANLTASVLYLHIYNATAASVTVGSTTPDLTLPVMTQGDTNGAGFVLSVPNGIAFGTAITVAATTDAAATASPIAGPAANGLIIAMGYA